MSDGFTSELPPLCKAGPSWIQINIDYWLYTGPWWWEADLGDFWVCTFSGDQVAWELDRWRATLGGISFPTGATNWSVDEIIDYVGWVREVVSGCFLGLQMRICVLSGFTDAIANLDLDRKTCSSWLDFINLWPVIICCCGSVLVIFLGFLVSVGFSWFTISKDPCVPCWQM